jgi:hypothetical protein
MVIKGLRSVNDAVSTMLNPPSHKYTEFNSLRSQWIQEYIASIPEPTSARGVMQTTNRSVVIGTEPRPIGGFHLTIAFGAHILAASVSKLRDSPRQGSFPRLNIH